MVVRVLLSGCYGVKIILVTKKVYRVVSRTLQYGCQGVLGVFSCCCAVVRDLFVVAKWLLRCSKGVQIRCTESLQ